MFALRLRSWKWWIVGVGFSGLEDCVLRALGGHEIAGLNHMSGGRHAGRRMGKRRHTLPSGWFGILRLRSFLLRCPRTRLPGLASACPSSQLDVADWMHFPDRRHPAFQAGRPRGLAGAVRCVEKERAIDHDRNWRLVEVIAGSRQLSCAEKTFVGG